MKPLKVYGWQSFRPGLDRLIATREIVAARSMAEVARIAGFKGPWQLFNLSQTGNAAEIALATSEPGTVFYRPIDGRDEEWRAAPAKRTETR